jgi:hypothetical protein
MHLIEIPRSGYLAIHLPACACSWQVVEPTYAQSSKYNANGYCTLVLSIVTRMLNTA